MAYQQKDGDFSLFTNNKGDNPARPDLRGSAQIDGITYELSGWIKKNDKGKFITGQIKVKAVKNEDEEPLSDLPF